MTVTRRGRPAAAALSPLPVLHGERSPFAYVVREGRVRGGSTSLNSYSVPVDRRAPHPNPLRASFARLDPARAGRGRRSPSESRGKSAIEFEAFDGMTK